jgi:hypothetical protein
VHPLLSKELIFYPNLYKRKIDAALFPYAATCIIESSFEFLAFKSA